MLILLGAIFFITAVGLNGAPSIVTFALVRIEFTDANFSLPPIASKYLSITVRAVTPAGIGFENSGFSTSFPYGSKYLTGIPVFSRLSTTSLPLPTTINLAFSDLKYLLATRCTSSTVTAFIFSRYVS